MGSSQWALTYNSIMAIMRINSQLIGPRISEEFTFKLSTKVNNSCGLHIHVDASTHTVDTLKNIVNIMAAKEDLLYKALDVSVARQNYCKRADLRFLDDINFRPPRNMDELEQMWYNGYGSRYVHYDDSRYEPCHQYGHRSIHHEPCTS